MSAIQQLELFPEMNAATHGNGSRRERLILPKLLTEAGNNMRLRAEQDRAHVILLKWADLESSGKLRRMKETTLQGEFLVDVFGNALGYSLFSEGTAQWHLQAQFAVPGGAADAALGSFSAEASLPPSAMIELKGPKVNVDRDRFNGRTPVQQLWDYLNVIPSCPWGIVCNYVSFRLYHRLKTPRAYELFTLQELRDEQRFRQFYCVFARGGLLPELAGQTPRAEALLKQTDARQLEVGAELYTHYHQNRVALVNHLMGPAHRQSLDQAIHAAQLLLDRIIFIAFCEDRRLLPAESIQRAWTDLPPFTRVTNPRWQSFLDLFRSIDQGNPRFNVTAYNGGLFKQVPEVDGLQLDDDWTNFFKEISVYDFQDEVGVEVLGHLFEQSITDLEALRESAAGAAGKPRREVLGKRKHEGIYYTPPKVTDYIVKATIGTCIQERFAALDQEHGLAPGEQPTTENRDQWIRCQAAKLESLKALRVCDPACGSGAFLIRAFDYLEARYEDLITNLCLQKGVPEAPLLDQVSSWVLRENLFGVDLSKEAVEITRLALWIRTAEEGKSLADLSQNIQQGNSVIDDPRFDPLAFDWGTRFPEVPEGKFDCVIGNPPYVKLQNFRKRQPSAAEFLVAHYRTAQTGNFDLYLPFVERGLDLLRPGGRLGFIAPSVWLFNEYGQGLRELVKERAALERFVDFMSHQVFRDATTYTALQIYSPRPRETVEAARAADGDLESLSFYPVGYASLGESKRAWALLRPEEQDILDTMRRRSTTLDKATAQIFQGLITSADHIYHLNKLGPGRYWSWADAAQVELDDDLLKPLVSGEDAIPFATPPTEKYLLFPYHVAGDECRLLTEPELKRHKRCWKYLRKHEAELRAREGGRFDDGQWWRFGRPQNLDKQELPKIGVPQTVDRLMAFIDPEGQRYFNNVRVNGILEREDKAFSLWYLLAILNSRATDYCFRCTAKPKDRGYFEANKQFIAPLPVPKTKKQQAIADLAERLADLHGRQAGAYHAVRRRFVIDLAPVAAETPPPLVKVPGKLEAFDELPSPDLIRALERFAKQPFTPQQRGEWDAYMTSEANQLATIKRQIKDNTEDLNERVYRLYGLTEEQIRRIEM